MSDVLTAEGKIKSLPMVYIKGEEMTRYAAQLMLENWLEPHVDTSAWEFFDLSCQARARRGPDFEGRRGRRRQDRRHLQGADGHALGRAGQGVRSLETAAVAERRDAPRLERRHHQPRHDPH